MALAARSSLAGARRCVAGRRQHPAGRRLAGAPRAGGAAEEEAPAPPLPAALPAQRPPGAGPRPSVGSSDVAGAPDRSEAPSYEFQGAPVPTSQPYFSFLYGFSTAAVLGLLAATGVNEGDDRAAALFAALSNDHAAVWAGDYVRLLTCNWLFASGPALGLNAVALLTVAPEVEALYGYARFNYIAVMTALTGAVGSLVDDRMAAHVGGSDVLFGMLGALLAYCLRNGTPVFRPVQLLGVLGVVVYNVGIGFQDGTLVDNAGAFCAATSGIVLGFGLGPHWRVVGEPSAGILVDRVAYRRKLGVGLLYAAGLAIVLAISAPGELAAPTSASGYYMELFGFP